MILGCSGWGCSRLISISNVPGGNPVALADPENYAIRFQICTDCHNSYCDRCVPISRFRSAHCKHCGGKLADGGQRQQVSAKPKAGVVGRYDAAYQLGVQGRAAECLAAFDAVVKERDKFIAAHFGRSIALKMLGRREDSIAALERVVQLDPGHAQAMFDIGGGYLAMGRLEQAIQAYDRALAVQPRYVSAMVNKALALSDLGRTEDAVRTADQAIALVEAGNQVDRFEHATAYANGVKGAALLKLGRNEEALAAIDIAVNDGPDDKHNYTNRATALERLGRADEARVAAQIAKDL